MTTETPRTSWVESADGHPDFPLQNLPLGIFSPPGDTPRGGVAIGDYIFDLKVASDSGLFHGSAGEAARAASGDSLNAFFALGAGPRRALRARLLELLASDSPEHKRLENLGAALLKPQLACRMHLPARVGDYTDFYVGIHHAQNIGKLFRPDNPLLPNYKYVPIGYHGRASTIVPSGTDVIRPHGQTLPPGQSMPTFGPSAKMDLELELGIWIGKGNEQGRSIPISEAAFHVAGFCLLNDWSARDIQAWEYQPLGPFLSKSFATTISPWVVTPEALEPFRKPQPPRAEGDPQPMPYLLDVEDQDNGALDIELEVLLLTERMHEQNLPPQRIALSNTLNMYWTVAQMVAHHSVNGCRLQPGDLFGSGTLSGEQRDAAGSLMELTGNGQQPISLPTGEERRFLEDGDEIILRARCRGNGDISIGFGECRGKILPAR
ncbi:Ureidoglycolate lyase [compost metagenome]